MLQRIDSYELTEWIAYLKLEERDRERDAKVQEAASQDNVPPGMRR